MLQTSPSTLTSGPDGPDADPSLYFQRCRWCGTAMYQRLLCTGCGSTDLEPERSAGEGVICVHRNANAAEDRWPVVMQEGFVVRCRVVGPRGAARPGDRVRLSPGSEPAPEPVVELCDAAPDEGWHLASTGRTHG